ncbi:MAG: MFS transporter [Clostridiales bacterium]|jgi:MFS family permease|nr:MFS transporter [Clostridiales bacterium]
MSETFKTDGGEQPISKRIWTTLILFGLFGQIAWAVENTYFNLFIYNTVAKSTYAVTIMVQASAIVATVTALVMGAVSDRTGNRRSFLSVGYILWGISLLAFAFINTENVGRLFGIDPLTPSGSFGLEGTGATLRVTATLAVIIVMDCVMTFFGSGANDATFYPWTTDNISSKNRAKAESVISVMPLLSLLIVSGGFGFILGEDNNYPRMFYIIGGIVIACGIAGLFLIRDNPRLKPDRSANLFGNIAFGFLPSTVKRYKAQYVTLLGWLIISIASGTFMPYLIIYAEQYLKFTIMEYSAVLGIVIILSAVGILVCGRFMERVGRMKMLAFGLIAESGGLFLLYFVHGFDKAVVLTLFAIFGFVMLMGMLVVTTVLGAYTRDFTPSAKAGKLQGVRMIAQVLIPGLIGPAVGDAINQRMASLNPDELLYFDTANEIWANIPAPEIFLVGGALMLLLIIPMIMLKRLQKQGLATPEDLCADGQ